MMHCTIIILPIHIIFIGPRGKLSPIGNQSGKSFEGQDYYMSCTNLSCAKLLQIRDELSRVVDKRRLPKFVGSMV